MEMFTSLIEIINDYRSKNLQLEKRNKELEEKVCLLFKLHHYVLHLFKPHNVLRLFKLHNYVLRLFKLNNYVLRLFH